MVKRKDQEWWVVRDVSITFVRRCADTGTPSFTRRSHPEPYPLPLQRVDVEFVASVGTIEVKKEITMGEKEPWTKMGSTDVVRLVMLSDLPVGIVKSHERCDQSILLDERNDGWKGYCYREVFIEVD